MNRQCLPLAFSTILLACLTPMMAYVWYQASLSHWTSSLLFLASVADALEAVSGRDAYDTLGRLTVFLYSGLLLHLGNALKHGTACRQPGLLRIAAGSLALATLADVGTYWIAGSANPDLRTYFFWWIEVPALSATVILTSIVGARALAVQGHRLCFWLLATAVPVAVAATATFQYLPHGMLLGLVWGLWGVLPDKND